MKEIDGFPGYFVTEDGQVWSERTKRFLKTRNVRGYPTVSLMKDRIQINKTVHRFVALAFIPNPDGKPQVDHIDCEKTNNRVSNLRWVTCAENIQAAWSNGLNERARELARESARETGIANSKRVRCLQTAQEFSSAIEASKFLGMKSPCAVATAISRGGPCGGFTWEYVDV